MPDKLEEDFPFLVVLWLLEKAMFLLLFAAFALVALQCVYFAFYGSWPALPVSLFFIEHGELDHVSAMHHPAKLIPNLFNSGPWDSWLGVWRAIEVVSIPGLFLMLAAAFYVASWLIYRKL